MSSLTLAEACNRLEEAIKSLSLRTCLEGCRCLHKNAAKWEVQPRTIELEEVEQQLAYIRMIRWNTSWVKYPPALQRDLVILIFSCIDILDRVGGSRRNWDMDFSFQDDGRAIFDMAVKARIKEWNENLERVLSALKILEQDMKRRFARASMSVGVAFPPSWETPSSHLEHRKFDLRLRNSFILNEFFSPNVPK